MTFSRKAYIVGIDKYQMEGAQLHGCVADARDMANTLVILGFPPSQIRINTNGRATKVNILAALERLVTNAEPGDVLVFYYSGHGTQIPDVNGDENDHIDEALCPVDLNWDKKNWILDDELKAIFAKMPPGVNLDVILDSCFSGTATRSLVPPESVHVHRYLPPPLDESFYLEQIPFLRRDALLRGSEPDIAGDWAIWSAARENQYSNELAIDGSVRGVFTYYYCKILRAASETITRREVYNTTNVAVVNAITDQNPYAEFAPRLIDATPFRKLA